MDDRELLKVVMNVVGKEKCADDCAEFACGGQVMVATTDMLHRSTDFVPGMTDWQAGWMSAAVTLSDIASMGAVPKYLLVAVGLDDWKSLEGVMKGAQDCCEKYGAEIIGGDIDRHNELTIVTTGLGIVERRNIARRTGAWPGDLICITGIPGQAQAWLDGYCQFETFLFEPQPRVEEGQKLAKAGVSAMMDDSDGIALSLYDLMSVNECGFALDSSKIPLPAGIPEGQARELALYGGGDYELIFSIAPDRFPVEGVPATVIGMVTEKKAVTCDGVPLERRGYQHRWE